MSLSRFAAICLCAFLVSVGSASAQLSLGGTPESFNRSVRQDIHTITMGAVDVEALLAEDEANRKLGTPYRFGYPFDVNYNMDNAGTWEKLVDGSRMWRLRIVCPGAHSINLIYSDFWMPEGARYFIYNEDRSMVIGAFTTQNNKEHGRFATDLVEGDVVVLEYYEPTGVTQSGRIAIERIVHGYRDMFEWQTAKDVLEYSGSQAAGFGQSGSCNNNVNCPEGDDWQDQKRSVAMVLLGSGSEWCSGTMINNVRQDLTPYFLTADHCLNNPSTFIIRFNYESPNCNNIDGPYWMTVSGTTLRANNSFSDFALLELSVQPPDSYSVYYAGWNAADTAADSIVAIHHPSGDIKKISFDYDAITATSYLGTSIPGNNSHWRIGQWEDGTTEGGSSGSPIFDREKRIKGQLHGGYASCTSITSDWYGKFSISWANGGSPSTRLKDWLDPDNTGTLALDGRDQVGVAITHEPLPDTRDTLNDYEVLATIESVEPLQSDSLLLYYQISSIWYSDTLVATFNPDEYAAYIPAQSPGTDIDYYLFAADTAGNTDTTEIFSFSVVDYAVTLSPESDTANGAVDDTVWYDLTVTNVGVYDDDYSLTLTGVDWPTTLWDYTGTTQISSTGNLQQDEIFDFKVRAIVPSSFYGETDTVTVTALSTGDPTVSASSILYTVSDGEPLAIPFVDEFPGTTFDIGKWVIFADAASNSNGLNEPSEPYSADLNGSPVGADTLMSQAIDLTGETNVIVRYWYEQTGGGDSPESNDDLYAEYLDSTGAWQLIQHHLGADPDMTEYELVTYTLPGDAFHNGFRVRFRNTATSGNFDDWFVDDVFVGHPPLYEMEMSPEFVGQFGPAGDTVSYLLTVYNQGLNSDDYALSDSGGAWTVLFYDAYGTTPINSTGLVAPADSVDFTAKVVIPSGAGMNEVDTSDIYAVSVNDGAVWDISQLATISAGQPGGFPWYEPFPYDTLFDPRWITDIGSEISSGSINPPSSPYALNLDGGNDTAVTQLIDLSGQSGVILSYYYQRGGSGEAPDAGDDLWVEYKNNVGSWVTVSQHPGADPIMTSFQQVNFALPADAYYNSFQIRLSSYGSGAGSDDWFVDDIRVDFAPDITITPDYADYALAQGDSTTGNLIIANDGLGGLNYNLVSVPVLSKNRLFAELQERGDVEPARRKYDERFLDYEDAKGADDHRAGFVVDKNAGGPDAHGYIWIDSDEPGGPQFDWIDVSATGTDIVDDLSDDNFGGPYPIGFSFPFYDSNYTQLYVGSNGIIGFGSDAMSSRFKASIPTSTTPNNILAWLWDDLNPNDLDNPNAHVYVDSDGERCVIQFVDYPEYQANAGDVVTAEVVLESDGTITFQYLDIAPGFDVQSCAVGMENADGADGLEVAFLSPYLKDSLAVQFVAPYQWLIMSGSSGSLAGGESDTIGLSITTAELDTGLYETNISVWSNDPDESPMIVPVSLTVTGVQQYICGDINDNGTGPDVEDLTYMVDYLFRGGPEPPIIDAANVDGVTGPSGPVDITDLSYLVDYLFRDGPDPVCEG